MKKNTVLSRFVNNMLFICLLGSSLSIANGQVLKDETLITINEDGKKNTERTIQIQINSKNENGLSHVELYHNPNQEIFVNYAYILDNEGNTIRELKKADITTRNRLSYHTFYLDDLKTEFDLYYNEYPYRIEYSYTKKETEYLYIALWTPVVFKNIITIQSKLKINLPIDLKVKVGNTDKLVFEEEEMSDRKVLSWIFNFVKIPQDEIYSPPPEKLVPIVKLVPVDFKYGISGKTDSWSTFGLWFDNLNKNNDELTRQEKEVIRKVVKGIDTRNELIKAVYYYLQDNIKYVNVSIDIGGLKSYPATYVCENKYGDCKALTTYMKAMLKYVGIESYYTIIKAGENNKEIDTNLPSQQFNHVILMIPSKNDTIWLENTSNTLPFNYLGTFTQNREGLAVNGEKSQLVKTPEFSLEDVLMERKYSVYVTNKDVAQVNLNLTIRGKSFERFKYIFHEKNNEKQVDEINRNHGIKDFKINDWNTIDSHRDSTFLQLNVDGLSSSIIRKIANFRVINPLMIELPEFENPDKRELDVIINFPINRFDTSVFDLQHIDQKEIQVPKGIKIENKYGKYYTDYIQKNEELIVIEKFSLFANKISINDYDKLYEFIETINNYKKKAAIVIK